MDTVTAFSAPNNGAADAIREIMRRYAMLLGLREAEAAALAQAIASGPERPESERAALTRVERAVLDPADADGSDRMLLATWLSTQDSDRDQSRLPKGAPAAQGLPMPAQNLTAVSLQDVAQLFGFGLRPRLEAGRGSVRGDF